MRFIGIDFSGNHRMWSPGCGRSNVWISVVIEDGEQVVVDSLCPVQLLRGDEHPFQRLIRFLKEDTYDAAAIDAPFSIPINYFHINNHDSLLRAAGKMECLKRPFPGGRALLELAGREIFIPPKPLRKTEQHWKKQGVNVRSTLWNGARGGAPMTSACLKLLHHAERPIWPWKPAHLGRILCEAFPAAQLKTWDLPFEGYNGDSEQAKEKRQEIVNYLVDKKNIRLQEFRSMMLQNADALDSVICAYAAKAIKSGMYVTGSFDDENLGFEGYIAVHI